MKLFRAIGVAVLGVILAASSVCADMMLTGRHQLVSVQADGSGSLLTFKIAISNTGTSSITQATLTAKDPLIAGDVANVTRLLGSLPAGDTVMIDWTVPSALPTDQLAPGMSIPLNIQTEAADDLGNVSSFEITSKGGEL